MLITKFFMFADNQDITELFDEFFLIPEAAVIQPVKEKEIIDEIPNNEFRFTGSNNKKALFIFNSDSPLTGNDLQMVENLVTRAIGWNMDDIALINLSQNTFATFQNIKEYFAPKHIIFWGCEDFLTTNKIPQKLYEVLAGKEMKVLTVESVPSYENQPELKKKLWLAIRELFELA